MKKGRFSEKKSGKRWLTSTWKASLSTWLKSGLTVPSSVTVEVSAELGAEAEVAVGRRPSPARRASHAPGWPRRWRSGSARASAAARAVEASATRASRKPTRPGSSARPDDRDAEPADPPPEQHAHPDAVAALEADAGERQPDLHLVAAIVDAAGAVPDPVGGLVFAAGGGVEDVALDAARDSRTGRTRSGRCRARRGSDPTQSSFQMLSRRLIEVLIRAGSGSSQWKAK